MVWLSPQSDLTTEIGAFGALNRALSGPTSCAVEDDRYKASDIVSGWQPPSSRGNRFLNYLDGGFDSPRCLVRESRSSRSTGLCFSGVLPVTPTVLGNFLLL